MTVEPGISSSNMAGKVGTELGNAFEGILNNAELNQLQELKVVAGWYREAKEDPTMIPSLITNKILEHMLEHLKPYFINLLIEHFKFETQARA